MKVFALSDVHADYEVNARWIDQLSARDYRDDVLILAGDVTDSLGLLERTLRTLVAKFRQVLYVPGNHEVWVTRETGSTTSLEKFARVCEVVEQAGASMRRFCQDGVSIIPLLSWYDYSFGLPGDDLRDVWMDYRACRWPAGFEPHHVARHFERLNDTHQTAEGSDFRITFSHFLPRIDVMPERVSDRTRMLYPVLGSARLDQQVRALKSSIHVYGHSHLNRWVQIDGVTYVNNAFGYPQETHIAAKRLLCVHST